MAVKLTKIKTLLGHVVVDEYSRTSISGDFWSHKNFPSYIGFHIYSLNVYTYDGIWCINRLTRTAVCEASEKRGGCDEVDSRGCYSVCRKCLSSRSEKRLVPDFFLTWSSAPRKQVHVWQVCHVASLCAAKSSSYPTVELPYFSIKISSYTTRWENFCPSYAESPVKWAPLIEVILYLPLLVLPYCS